MTDLQTRPAAPAEDQVLTPLFVKGLVEAVDASDEAAIRDKVMDLHASDLAELLELLGNEERRAVVLALDSDLDPDVLPELEEQVRDEVVDLLDPEVVAAAVQALESDEAVYVLEDLEKHEQREILEQIPAEERAVLESSLHYPEDSAGRLMQREVVAVPPFWTIGQTIDYMRETDDLPEQFYEIFVVDPAHKPIGTILLSYLMRTKRPALVSEIMQEDQTLIPADMDQEDVSYQFEKYNLISAAVVDADGKLVGAITADDIVEVMSEEADEDIGHLGGVGDESFADSLFKTQRMRAQWLVVNLCNAILASIVISFYEESIEKLVALAILMPIVAHLGGNAGTQALTVAVRALARKDIVPFNTLRVIQRELGVAFLNGLFFAILLSVITILWFGNVELGIVIAIAMFVNMLVAGTFGILVPITLERLGVDPAIASGVFVTSVCDVVGFLVFLGLATAFLL